MLYSHSVFQPAEALTGNLRNIFTDFNCKLMVRSSITKKKCQKIPHYFLRLSTLLKTLETKFRSCFINPNEDVLTQGRAYIEFFIMIAIQ